MFCSNCGQQNPDGSRFCSECGAEMDTGSVQGIDTQGIQPAKKSSGGFPVWLIVVLVLTFCGVPVLGILAIAIPAYNDYTIKAKSVGEADKSKEAELAGDEIKSESTQEAGKTFRDCPECPEMVILPPGSFMMGSPESEPEHSKIESPQHKVSIAYALAVGKYEVTFAEWDACVAAGGCSHKPEDEGWGRGKRPVIDVSWQDAQQYV